MLRFTSCTVDPAARVLTRAGELQHLEPQAYDVLAHLLRHRDRVVTKEELLDTVWGGQWVSESALATRIKEIRRATGDTGDVQSIVRTIRGHGYQFVATVSDDEDRESKLTVLVGRDRELRELEQRFAPGSLLSLVGPGGVGKTTLARSLVERVGARFRHGVAVVDLTVLESPEQLIGAVARATQISESAGTSLPDVLRRLDTVLLLDDADEMVPEVARFCSPLTAEGSRIAVVVTTRERLGVRGEQLWPVLPLSAVAARELLTVRARDLAPLGSLHSASGSDLDALSNSVDRLPLAVEMLAGMSAFLNVQELQQLVDERLDLVTTNERDAPARHRSLDVLVNSSIERLDDRPRRVLTQLTSFAGAFTTSQALVVIDDDDGMSILRELVDRSLLSPIEAEGGPRFQMLRTVRQAILRVSAPDELQLATERHAQSVTNELARADEELHGEHEALAAPVFERLADEARTAHAWARLHDRPLAVRLTAVMHLYAYSRLWAEPAQWAAALFRDGTRDGPVVAMLASQAAQEGRFAEAADLAETLLGDADDTVRGWALEALSDVEIYLGKLRDAQAHAQELVDLGHEYSRPRMVSIGLTNAALARVYSDRPDEALEFLNRQLSESEAVFAPSDQAWLAYARGEAFAVLQDDRARLPLLEAVRLGDEVGNRFVAGIARSTLASMEVERDNLAVAASTYADVLDTFLRHGNLTHLRISLRNVIPLMARLDEPADAAVVGAWLFNEQSRPGYGKELDAALDTLGVIRAKFGDAQMAAWNDEAATLSATDAAERSISTLRRVPH